MLTRLTDRALETPEKTIRVKRYGMWGTSAEIEGIGKKFFVVFPNGRRKEFQRLVDAEMHLKELVERR